MNRATFQVTTITAMTVAGLMMASTAQANPESSIAWLAKRSPGEDLKGQSPGRLMTRSHHTEVHLTRKDIPDYYLPFNHRIISNFMSRRMDQITSGSASVLHTPTSLFATGF